MIVVAGCIKDSPPDPPSGSIAWNIGHFVDGDTLAFNKLIYSNAAGNPYMVTDLMYFISGVTLYPHGGSPVSLGDTKDIFYVDEKLPATKTIRFPDRISVGTYDSVSFIFGIREEENVTGCFTDPPEALMGWPAVLGGGYHYIMMNGRWETPSGGLVSYNFHLGIGQLYHGTGYITDSIYAYVQNWFRVSLPGSGFTVADGQNLTFTLRMNIAEWFRDPVTYDFNHFGGAMMQNQEAQEIARKNGWNVFSLQKN